MFFFIKCQRAYPFFKESGKDEAAPHIRFKFLSVLKMSGHARRIISTPDSYKFGWGASSHLIIKHIPAFYACRCISESHSGFGYIVIWHLNAASKAEWIRRNVFCHIERTFLRCLIDESAWYTACMISSFFFVRSISEWTINSFAATLWHKARFSVHAR